jgi:hypothetical protein
LVGGKSIVTDSVGVRCANCHWTDYQSQVKPAKDLMERLDGPVVLLPIGECPSCGALVYNPDDEEAYDLLMAKSQLCELLLDRLGWLDQVLDLLRPTRMRGDKSVFFARAVEMLRPPTEYELTLEQALSFVERQLNARSDPRLMEAACRVLADKVESKG